MKSNNDRTSCFEQDNSDIIKVIRQSNENDEKVPEFFELVQNFDEIFCDDYYENAEDPSDIAIKTECNKYPEEVMKNARLESNKRVFFGTLIPINHYYCTIDTKVLIWPMKEISSDIQNSENKQNNIVQTINEKCESITCVSCGPTNQFIFRREATHVIVVATNRHLSIYPYHEKKHIIVDKPIRTSLMMFIVTAIAISDRGQIFLGSDTGNIYLVSYRLSKYNLTQCVIDINYLTQYRVVSFFQRLIPYKFLNIKQLAICTLEDGSLYIAALYWSSGEKSQIIFYHFNNRDSSLKEIFTFYNYDLKYFVFLKSQNYKEITNIVSVPISDSRFTRFIAFTKDGKRLFFNETENDTYDKEIYLYRVRYPPSKFAEFDGLIDGHYSLGVSVFLFRHMVVITRTNQMSREANVNPVESVSMFKINESNGLAFSRGGHIFSNRPFKIFNNEMLWQHLINPSQGYLMTSEGVHIFTFSMPVDRLSCILKESNGNYTGKVGNWMKFYDRYCESSACSLLLASKSAMQERKNVLFILYQFSNQKILQSYKYYGKNPSENSGRPNGGQISFQQDSYNRYYKSFMEDNILMENLSNSCSAFVMRASRLMKPILDFPIFTRDFIPGRQRVNIIYDQLPKTFISSLSTLKDLANDYMKIDTDKRAHEAGIYSSEAAVLKKFRNYMETVISTMTFIQILKELDRGLLTSALDSLEDRYKNTLKDKPFGYSKDCDNSPSSSNYAELFESLRELAAALYKKHPNPQYLENQFSDKCPDFFNEADARILNSLEQIRKADPKKKEAEKPNLISSKNTFVKESKRRLKLKEICQIYEKFEFYDGIVEVCVSRALSLDSDQCALQWYKNGCKLDDKKGKEIFDKRYQCYQYIFELESLPKVFKTLLSTNDELFHICLYDYIIYKCKNNEELLKSLFANTTQFLETFLREKAMQHLWKYYSSHKKYDKAGNSLLEIIKDREDKSFKNVIKINGDTPNLEQRALWCLKVISFAKGSGNILLLNEAQRLYRLSSIQIEYNQKVLKYDDENSKSTFDGENNYILDQQELFDMCSRRGFWDLVLKLFSFCAINTSNKEMSIGRAWENFLVENIGGLDIRSVQHEIVMLINSLYNNPNTSGSGKGTRIEVENDVMNLNVLLPLLENFKYYNNAPLLWAFDTLIKCGNTPEELCMQYLKLLNQNKFFNLDKRAEFVYIVASIINNNFYMAQVQKWNVQSFKDHMDWFVEKAKDLPIYDDCKAILKDIYTLL